MAEENVGVPTETTETQKELTVTAENTDATKTTPREVRREISRESKLASLAKRSRPFRSEKSVKKENTVDLVAKFTEGVFFKAKIIGVEDVPDARGDRMCQISLQRLKAVVKNSGEHKTKVTVCVSIEGLKIREEKTADLLYHHPVHRISFISQDMSDVRAFGYIFGSPDLGHRFYALKTEKAASMLVVAMRDLFQVVYDMKKQEIEMARQHRRTLEEQELAAQLPQSDSSPDSPPAQSPDVVKTPENEEGVDDLLDLESELNNLRQGISQIDTSISAAEVKRSQEELDKLFDDPFGDSFIAPPQATTNAGSTGGSPVPASAPAPAPAQVQSQPAGTILPPPNFKKGPTKTTEELASLFDAPITSPQPEPEFGTNPFASAAPFPATNPSPNFSVMDADKIMDEGSHIDSTILSPEKPFVPPVEEPDVPAQSTESVDVLAALDPLGQNRPFVNKQQFFKELKPQKKSLKDMNSGVNSHVSMTLSRNPFDVESGVQSETVLSMSSPPLPSRLPPPVNPSSSPSLPQTRQSKNPDKWVNFDTSPPEAPPPLPPSDSVPPTPPPRPPITISALGSTPPLPKREKPPTYSPNPFITPYVDPRNCSDPGYDSYDDTFENVGTSPSSTSSPPTSPPIPIPARRPPMSHLRFSPLIYDHSNSVASRPVVIPAPPTSHSLPASKVPMVIESVLSHSPRRKTSESIVASSGSPGTLSNHSTPEPVRKQSSNSNSTVTSEETFVASPNPFVSAAVSSNEEKEEEPTTDSSNRYAAIESLERGNSQSNFSSIFDSYLQNTQPETEIHESKMNTPSTFEVPASGTDSSNLCFQKSSVVDDPFVVKIDNIDISAGSETESKLKFETSFPDVFTPESKPESDELSLSKEKVTEELTFDKYEAFKSFDIQKTETSSSEPKKTPVENGENVLSPVSYLNSKDIFHRESDPFDDDFFQSSFESDASKKETNWAVKAFEDFEFKN